MKFEIRFMYDRLLSGVAVVEAGSQEEAEAVAESMNADDDRIEFTAIDGQLEIQSVGEQAHDE